MTDRFGVAERKEEKQIRFRNVSAVLFFDGQRDSLDGMSGFLKVQ